MVWLELLFWISLVAMLSAYLIYPLLVIYWPRRARPSQHKLTQWPTLEVIFAAHNEEKVLAEKLDSLLTSHYPGPLSIRVGSDYSTDDTNEILKTYAQKEPQRVVAHIFEERQGKAGVINKLVNASQAELICLTDANIIFRPNSLKQLCESLLNSQAAACGGQIVYQQKLKKGIAQQEDTYLNIENRLKSAESALWKAPMGLEGGCYLIWRKDFPVIPPLYFMEDFFVTMSLLSQGKRVIFEPRALVNEDVSTSPQEEYKRKVRISIGNFQNLRRFAPLIALRFWPVGFAFLFHKVLRWLTPFFLILALICALWLKVGFGTYNWAAYLVGLAFLIGLTGLVGLKSTLPGWLKFPGHFLYMNLALLEGFFKYLKGVESNVWKPTERKQH